MSWCGFFSASVYTSSQWCEIEVQEGCINTPSAWGRIGAHDDFEVELELLV